VDCTKDVDCPWWSNAASQSCSTGNVVPAGIWTIYPTRESCCDTLNFPTHSCNPIPITSPPTKHPTILMKDDIDDDFEIVPLRLDIRGLPPNYQMRKLKEEMMIALKWILVRLTEEIDGLSISDIKERDNDDDDDRNRNGRALVLQSGTVEDEERLEEQHLATTHRFLEDDVTLHYNVYVVRDNDRKFAPLLIKMMKERFVEVLDYVKSSPNMSYLNDKNVDMDFCSSEDGQFHCITKSDVYEIVPLRLNIDGLPINYQRKKLKEESMTVLKWILTRLAERMDGLRISDIREREDENSRALMQRSTQQSRLLLRGMTGASDVAAASNSSPDAEEEDYDYRTDRELLEDVTLYYNIFVVRDKSRRFGPLIISMVRERFGEVLDYVQSSPNMSYLNSAGVNMNFCSSENGQFSDCANKDNAPVSAPSTSITINNNKPTVYSPTNTVYSPTDKGSSPTIVLSYDSNEDNDESNGVVLSGWAIFLIVLLALVVLCCIVLCLVYLCCKEFCCRICCCKNRRGDKSGTKEVNNIYVGNGDNKNAPRHPRRSHRTAANDNDETAIVLARPMERKYDEDSAYSVDTFQFSRAERGNHVENGPKERKYDEASAYSVDTFQFGRVERVNHAQNALTWHDDRLDPEAASQYSTNSNRKYYHPEDPSISVKAKREPTMYINGLSETEPTKPKREPTMYVDGLSYSERSSQSRNTAPDPIMYLESQHQADPYIPDEPGTPQTLETSREPTMYIDGNAIYDSDAQSFRTEEPLPHLDRSNRIYDTDIVSPINRKSSEYISEISRAGAPDPSYYFEESLDGSYRTHPPRSVASASEKRVKKSHKRSKKSKKSKDKSQH